MTRLYGWVGKILRVNLTNGEISEEETMKYTDNFIGGRGINAKIAWEETGPEINAFDPANRLTIMTGPLTGTAAPGVGKVMLGTRAPQTYPKPAYTRSSMGGSWGTELKYAGYDGIVIWGKAPESSYLWINDREVEMRDGKELWGLDIFATQKRLQRELGDEIRSIAIGPAGERLSRISIIENETENAAGQGGFGAVMGSKNLKAVAVKGNGVVRVADPDKLIEIYKHIKNLTPENVLPDLPKIEGRYEQKYSSCEGCPNYCRVKMVVSVPGRIHPETYSSEIHCVETRWLVKGWNIPHRDYENEYPELPKDMPEIEDLASAFEAKVLGNMYGLNMWEVTLGIVPWLKMCVEAGIITEERLKIPLELNRGEFWSELFRKIAYREGFGDVLAEGIPRAADIIGEGHEYLTTCAHGYVEHWIGRGIQSALTFPYWILSALIWATDSRDPFSDTHDVYRLGYSTPHLSEKQERAISETIYGSNKTTDPTYEHKAQRAIWHQNRCAAKETLVLCESIYPIITSTRTSNGFGDTSVESMLLSAVTGLEIGEKELDHIGERVFNLERAIMLREGRSREYDVNCGIIEYLSDRPDTDGITLDEKLFMKTLDEYYSLRGWDAPTGKPTAEKLIELNLRDSYNNLKKCDLIP